MSVATTVKLPPRLKKRIAPLAKAAGKTAHAWMELRRSFVAEALESQAEVTAGGPVYAAEDVFAYLSAKVAGKKPKRPAARTR